MKEVQICQVIYKDIKVNRSTAPMIRGYFANKYNEIEQMHNHKDNKFIYRYPHIQYKVLNNNPVLLGIEDGAKIIQENDIFLDDVIKIGQQEFESNQREISFKKVKLGVSDEIIKYKFITPWLALNQNNIKKYTAADLIEKEEILKRVLIGNILSFSKGMDYTVDKTIKVKLDLNQIDVKFKQKEMLAFIGEFFINFEIPDNFAIGKGISRGFGTVKKI